MRELILIIMLFFSCSSEKQAEQSRSPSGSATGVTRTYALAISPEAATRDSTVNLILTGFDTHDAQIQWLINGGPAESSSSSQFKCSQARKGDTLQARARIQDREILSNIIEIVNTPPEITGIKMRSETDKPRVTLSVAVSGSDMDGDQVTFLYEWTKNGEPAGKQERIEGTVKRGDAVVVKVTPFDGESYGRPIELNRTMQNIPPIIHENKEFHFDGTLYTYQVRASDSDNDPLTYALESPPPGMTIDKSSGLITWSVPAEFKGSKDLSVVVADGQGGTAQYVVKIIIQ